MGIYAEYYGLADDIDLELVAKRQLNRSMLDEHRNFFNPLRGRCGDLPRWNMDAD